jgi:hypothetical protein
VGYWLIAGNRREEYAVEPAPERWRTQRVVNLTCLVESPQGFGTLMRSVPPAPFYSIGCRITAWLRPDGLTKWAGLWARVDGPHDASLRQSPMLAFDNMGDRPVRGTGDWHQYDVVLDVPPAAISIAYGVSLEGAGTVGIAGLRLTTASPGMPRTGNYGPDPSF